MEMFGIELLNCSKYLHIVHTRSALYKSFNMHIIYVRDLADRVLKTEQFKKYMVVLRAKHLLATCNEEIAKVLNG